MPQEINHSISVNRPNPFVKAEPEHYRGMFYVRLSNIPVEQKLSILESHLRDTIIKIIKDDSLMSDCMLYSHYVEWLNQNNSLKFTHPLIEVPELTPPVPSELLSLS